MKKYWSSLLFLVYLLPVCAQVPGSPIDVKAYKFNLVLNDGDNSIKGKAVVTVNVLKNTNAIALDLVKKNDTGMGMEVISVTENGRKLKFTHNNDVLNIQASPKAKTLHSYTITYSGIPADGLIISTNKFGDRTFFGDNWLNRARYWLPCVDNVADKAAVDFNVTAPAHYDVVANGIKVAETETGKTKLTRWSEETPIATKIMVIGVAKFAIDKPGKVRGIPVYSYVFPQDKEVGFKSYAMATEILPFFMDKIGPYAYRKLANVQSKTIFNGMENASVIFYSQKSVTDADVEELIAHEVAHQWFGDAVTEMGPHHVWLSEGFASYLAHYYLENKYGVDSLNKRMLFDRNTVFAFERKRQTPVVDTIHVTNYMDLLNDNSYEKASWVLHMLRRKLGDTTFWQGIRTYYSQYKNSNATTQDFVAVMEKTSGQNLQQFFKQWLYTTGHPRLLVEWNYDKTNHGIHLRITQKQEMLYNVKLDLKIGNTLFSADVSERVSDVNLAAPTEMGPILADPNVSLLADVVVTEVKAE